MAVSMYLGGLDKKSISMPGDIGIMPLWGTHGQNTGNLTIHAAILAGFICNSQMLMHK